mgnify:CR=1 FL=1
MKICTWNCRYGLTPEKAAHICQAGYNADIYAIQEYDMLNNKPIPEIEKCLGQLQDKYGDGKEYKLKDVEPPTREEVEKAEGIFKSYGLKLLEK